MCPPIRCKHSFLTLFFITHYHTTFKRCFAMLGLHPSTVFLASENLWLWFPWHTFPSSKKICVSCTWKRQLGIPSSHSLLAFCEVSLLHLSFFSVFVNSFHISLNFLVGQRMWSRFQATSFQMSHWSTLFALSITRHFSGYALLGFFFLSCCLKMTDVHPVYIMFQVYVSSEVIQTIC